MKYLYCKGYFFFDMVSDKVKLRAIIPFSIVFILFILVSSIFTSLFSGRSVPTNTKVVISPQTYLEVGQKARSFMIQITDQNLASVPNMDINIFVINYILNINKEPINCDFNYLNQNYWNYFFIRNLGPCEIKILGQNEKTDSNGFAYFNDFCFEHSPQGSYYLAFKVIDTDLISSSFNLILGPSAVMIKMLNSPPKKATVNSPLEIQPQLITYDKFGIPLENVTINAVSWPYGDYNPKYPQLFDADDDKFAFLSGGKSIVSNKEGFANFANLTILGSSHENVYIIFIPEGNQIIVPWVKAIFPDVFVGIDKFQHFIPPIKLVYSNIHQIKIIQPLPTTIIEGTQIYPLPTLKLIDNQTNLALSGYLCFAILRSFANLNFPVGYQPLNYRQKGKSILRGITGKYKECSTISIDCLYPIKTNTEGIVEYSDLEVSQGGSNYQNSQNIGILFLCGNGKSDLLISNITTSVWEIEFLNLPNFLDTSRHYFEIMYNDTYCIRIKDVSNKPIVNKIVNKMELVDKNMETQTNILVRNYFDVAQHIWSYSLNSDEFGIINAILLIYRNNNGKFSQYYLKITIDGVSAISQSLLNITMRVDHNGLCNFLDIKNGITSFNLRNDEKLNLTLIPNDLVGNSNLNHELYITIFSSYHYYIYHLYDTYSIQYYYFTTQFRYTIPKSSPSIEIKDISLGGFPNGSYISYFVIESENIYNNEENNTCMSNPLIFNLFNSINKVIILKPDFTLNDTFWLGMSTYDFDVVLQIINSSNLPLQKFNYKLQLSIYSYPSIYIKELFGNLYPQDFLGKEGPFSLNSSSGITDDDGKIFLKISLNSRYRGEYNLAFLVSGISSDPFMISVTSALNSLEILKFPDPKNNYSTLVPFTRAFEIVISGSMQGEHVRNFPIIAFFYSKQAESFIDIFDSNSQYIWNKNRINYTNDNGLVIFNNLSVLSFDNSIEGQSCIDGYFIFQSGINRSLSTKPSTIYTICSSEIIIYPGDRHSFLLSFNNYLITTIKGIFQESFSINSMNSDNPLLFNLRVSSYENNNYQGHQSLIVANNLLVYNLCLIDSKEVYQSSCVLYKNPSENNQNIQQYSINFEYLYWIYLTNNKRFDLVICLFNFCNYTSQTLNGMKLTSGIDYLKFYQDFPPQIYIGTSLEIRLGYTTLAEVYTNIICNIVTSSALKIKNSSISTIINVLSSNLATPDFLNFLSQDSRIQLNTLYNKKTTDIDGIVLMNFEFISGKSGYYQIFCETDSGISVFSNSFYINNTIKNIYIANNNHIELSSLFNVFDGSFIPVNFTLNSTKIIIMDINNHSISNLENDIKVEIYDESLFNSATINSDPEQGLLDQLITFYHVLIEGVSALESPYKKLTINSYYNSLRYENLSYIFENLILELPMPGDYWLKYVCKGIESNFSEKISVIQIDYDNAFDFICFNNIYFFIASIVIIILSNSIHCGLWALLIATIVLLFNISIFIKSFLTDNFSLVLGLILLLMIAGQLVLIIFNIIKYSENKHFYFQKSSYFIEHARKSLKNMLFHKFNTQKSSVCHLHYIKKLTNDQASSDLNSSLNSRNEFVDPSRKYNKKISFERREGVFNYLKEVCYIFKTISTKDSFYYPQRMISSALICLFTLIFCIFQVTTLIFSFISAISFIQKCITSNILSYINSLFSKFQINLNYELKDFNLETYYSIIQEFTGILNDFQFSIKIALILSNVIVSIIFIGSLISLLIRFKRKVLKAMYSKKLIQKFQKSSEISKAGDLIGLIMGSTAISYIIVTIFLSLIFGILLSKYFWIFLWEYRTTILIILLPTFIQMALDFVIKKLIFLDDTTIRLPNILQLYDIYLLIISILDGIVASFGRLIFGLIGLFVGLIRFDKSIIPEWINLPILEDEVVQAFEAEIALHILYNNVIFNTFIEFLIISDKERTKTSKKRLWLYFLLITFLDIKKKRKSKKNLIIGNRKGS